MTHTKFSLFIMTGAAIWFVATAGLFFIVTQWMTTTPETFSWATSLAKAGAAVLLLMPGSTAFVVCHASRPSLRRWLLLAAAFSGVAGAFHEIVPWFSAIAFAWCLSMASVACVKMRAMANKREAAPYAIALITAVVLAAVAVTSWYVFDVAIPEYLKSLIFVAGHAYDAPSGTLTDINDKMTAMMTLGGPLAFVVVGIIWNAGSLILISFHERFAPR